MVIQLLIYPTQTPPMCLASSSGLANVKPDLPAPSHILPMSRPSIHHVNISLKYTRARCSTSRDEALISLTLCRAIASLGRSVLWPMFSQMEESSIDQMAL